MKNDITTIDDIKLLVDSFYDNLAPDYEIQYIIMVFGS